MLIDWFVVVAQVINFAVLVWLLKRFLYRPILELMARREQQIRDRVDAASVRERVASEEAARLTRSREALEASRAERLAQTRAEAERLRGELEEQARVEVAATKQRWLETVERDREVFLGQVARRVGSEAIDVARRALRDLAAVDLNERVVDTFLSRLHDSVAVDPTLEQALQQMRKSGEPIVVRSAFELSPALEVKVTSALERELGVPCSTRFAVEPALIYGLQLATEAHEVSLSLADYLGDLEPRFASMITHELEEMGGAARSA